jgi:hypothetical protein
LQIIEPPKASSDQPTFQKILRPEHIHSSLLNEKVDLQGIVQSLTIRALRFKVGETLNPDGKVIEYGSFYNDFLFDNASPERTFVILGRVEIKVLREELQVGNVRLPKKTVIVQVMADERSINSAIDSIFEVFTRLSTLDAENLPNFLKGFVRP